MKSPETGGLDNPHDGSAKASICSTTTRISHRLWFVALICFCLASLSGRKTSGQEGQPLTPGESQRGVGDTANQAGPLEAMVRNILDFYFKPPAGRAVVVVCDREKLELASALTAGLQSRGRPARTMLIGDDLESFTKPLGDLFENHEVGLMILASPRMWKGLRLAQRLEFRDRWPSLRSKCSPVFFDTVIPLPNMLRVYSADPAETQRFLSNLQQQLPSDSRVRILAPGGTDIAFVSRRWEIWGWEVLTYPVENSVNGTIVADAGVFFSKVNAPIKLHILEGKLDGIECSDPEDAVFKKYVQWMNKARDADSLDWQLAEVGIGGNANARITDVLMETEVVRGTTHFCFGDNSMFGGEHKTSWHGGTVVVDEPRFEFDARTVRLTRASN